MDVEEKTAELLEKLLESTSSEKVVSTKLMTDERVIARVTDGIYRQPGSALRELISNAYDADATRVVISTDAPRFNRILVEDNGHGMPPQALANLIHHIGGSAKRTPRGQDLGITSSADSSLSPAGRPLIGKIGIGLFSVSQLTNTFQIITKTKGDRFRSVATVALRQYSDDSGKSESDGEEYEAGKVNLWREPASDVEAHGTTIVLTGIRPQARDTLRTQDVWAAIEEHENLPQEERFQALEPPKYHIGRIDSTGQFLSQSPKHLPHLPWKTDDSPDAAFSKLVGCVWDEVRAGNPNPKLDALFDYYLRMIWQLSLAVPLPYVHGHPFDKATEHFERTFHLSNRYKQQAIPLEQGQNTPRELIDLCEPCDGSEDFEVYIDSLRLSRPISFDNLPSTTNALTRPLLFVGKCEESFSSVPIELSGGPLKFEAYLVWNPKIAPTEHQGALIRVKGASGTLFDPTFLRYQVAELTRLKQITCEIFVREGLDSALNIDRESFNTAHPHVVFVVKWLHNALRQLATAQKRLASEARSNRRGQLVTVQREELRRIPLEVWLEESGDPGAAPPTFFFSSSDGAPSQFDYSIPLKEEQPSGSGIRAESVALEKLEAIGQVLASFGLLDSLPVSKQSRLMQAILDILRAERA